MTHLGYVKYNNKGLNPLTQHLIDSYKHERFSPMKELIRSLAAQLEEDGDGLTEITRSDLLYLLLNELLYTRLISYHTRFDDHTRQGLSLLKLTTMTINVVLSRIAKETSRDVSETENLLGFIDKFADTLRGQLNELSEAHASGSLGVYSVFGPTDEDPEYSLANIEEDAALLLAHLTGDCNCGAHANKVPSNTVVDEEGGLHANEL